MSKVEEIRMKKEFENLQLLQKDPRTAKIIGIQYNPRGDADLFHWAPVLRNPQNGLYPYRFRITYTMPMFIGPGQLVENWQGSFIFEAPPEVLVDPNSEINVQIDGDFPFGVPYNNHVERCYICSGTAWKVSRGLGIWFFVLCLGGLLNQEPFVMSDSGTHLNGEAFRWWRDQRKMEPNSHIDWPYDLLDKNATPTFQFGAIHPPIPAATGLTFRPHRLDFTFSNPKK